MKKVFTVLNILLVVAFFSGCATLFSGTSDEIRFESEPSGADIYIEGLKRGETPATIEVDRPGLNDKYATLKMEGYKDRRFKLRKDFTTVSILNLGNILFWGIDIVTGAVMNYSQRAYDVELDPEGEAHLLQELPRDAQGNYLIPEGEQSVKVSDAENGLTLVFSK